jgi:hypothetical protein
MVENKDLKCFVRVAKNGAKYRACLPKKDTPYKKKQDLRKNPHSEGKRKQPRQLAYPSGRTAADKRDNDKKTGVDSGRAVIIRRWQKKIDAETTKEGKAEMAKRRNMVLAKYEKDKKGKKVASGGAAAEKKPIKFKVKGQQKAEKEKEPEKKVKLTIGGVRFKTKDGKVIKFKPKPKK